MKEIIDKITEVLKQVKYPGFSRDIISFGIVKKIHVDPNNNIQVDINLNTNNPDHKDILNSNIVDIISKNFNFNNIKVDFLENTSSNQEQQKNTSNKIKNIIAISSCKGGVGKSTVALNLAYEMSKSFKVGLLDLDIYGPSLPTLINYHEQPKIENNILFPVVKHGIKFMSFGFINNESSPTIWRGPMVSRMTEQFFENVDWGDLDYLFLDLPPGTGDIQLTLVQKISLTGAIIITTPQILSSVDVIKGSDMFKKVNTPILGIIENMSGLKLEGKIANFVQNNKLLIDNREVVIDSEGKFIFEYDIFKGNAGNAESKRLNLPLLGKINLDEKLSESCDSGTPFIKKYEGSIIQKEFSKISSKIAN
tara:strand:- start:115 stop:1209 length:1095 start_codon:yes stop_codon:yes gene_type:complete